MRWRSEGSKRVGPKSAERLSTTRFKARADLVAYVAKRPGALAGGFLVSVYETLHSKVPEARRDLRRASVSTWAQRYGNLQGKCDQREVATLAMCMDLVSKRDLAQVMDVMAQRLLAILQAKANDGSWDKAQRMAPEGGLLAPSGMSRLLA